jgi:hypothetical protein
MHGLTTAWTLHAAELRGWLLEVARKLLADHLRVAHPMVALPEDLRAQTDDTVMSPPGVVINGKEVHAGGVNRAKPSQRQLTSSG